MGCIRQRKTNAYRAFARLPRALWSHVAFAVPVAYLASSRARVWLGFSSVWKTAWAVFAGKAKPQGGGGVCAVSELVHDDVAEDCEHIFRVRLCTPNENHWCTASLVSRRPNGGTACQILGRREY